MEILDKNILERLQHTIIDMDLDLTAESIVSGLERLGIPPEQIVVQNKNTSKRPCRKDVSCFHTDFIEYDDKEYLFLHANRDGVYDSLPENIFHQEKGGRTEKNKYEVIDQIKTHKQEEEDARKFFLPFECEYQHIKNLLYTIEEDFEKDVNNPKLIKIFSNLWPVLNRLDDHHGYIFLRIIPMINIIRNDFELVARSMGMILDAEIDIIPYIKPLPAEETATVPLGVGELGKNMITSGPISDGETDLIIKVNTLHGNNMKQFLKGGKKEGLVEEIADFFIGANYFIKVEVTCKEQNFSGFNLNKDQVLLGVNSVLQPS
ncbi:hypothetical protein RCC89_01710 [Cytophagaceae bacterium ABcell3]|nr:hypothetical protein RCC89_01710 [Cytophagaceae bacterium ABcell3]